MSYLPLFHDTRHLPPILVIGGGVIAAAKVEALSSVSARLEVLAQDISQACLDLCQAHGYLYTQTTYSAAFLEGKRIVIAATDDDALNARIANECRERGILVNVVDNPPLCDFIFPALVRRGALQVAISSSSISPVLARMVKQRIEAMLPASFERLIIFMQETKSKLRGHLTQIQPRRLFSEQVVTGAIAEEVLEGNDDRAHTLFDAALNAYPDVKQPALYLIGAGAGNPDLLTLKAIRLLGRADVILVDRLVAPEIINQFARKDAQKIFVGKTRCHHHKKQEDIDALLEEHLRAGRIVARLKGGDPGIYAHGAEEIAVAKRLGVPYQIVPGITAASACAAYAGIPLTERGGALSVRFLTIYKEQLHDATFWEGLRYATRDTLVLYMSSHHYSTVCNRLIAEGFAPDTPLLVIEQGSTPYHREYASTLAEFYGTYGAHCFASPCLMIIGDVTRWREEHHWKEAPTHPGDYFPPIPTEEAA